ncbi:hypothetical protein [Treponema pedis]|uniref:Uncharacterized protein n=1 Tax=Treponema pedis str. T A4 TaxID=1291379 RepID=S6A3Q4_9SPIR|nr:hypothetical protein [Treponema pedis]AGT43781.1 hypothetical protein TPE_1286 [Treponema pedis str. T A4]
MNYAIIIQTKGRGNMAIDGVKIIDSDDGYEKIKARPYFYCE